MREKRKPKTKGFANALKDAQDAMRPFFDERREVEARECPARIERLRSLHVNIDTAGGNCPVQIEGTAKGRPFYFRARGEHWSLGIGGEPVGAPDWSMEEEYGTWPDAGWMRLHEAYDLLERGVTAWLARDSDTQAKPGDAQLGSASGE